MISLQSNITQNLEQFKSCNTFLSVAVGWIPIAICVYVLILLVSISGNVHMVD